MTLSSREHIFAANFNNQLHVNTHNFFKNESCKTHQKIIDKSLFYFLVDVDLFFFLFFNHLVKYHLPTYLPFKRAPPKITPPLSKKNESLRHESIIYNRYTIFLFNIIFYS